MEDSLLLWRGLVSNKLLEKVPIVLFLNKCDLLQEKLEAGVRFKNYLLTYGDRPNEYESVTKCARLASRSGETTADVCFIDLRNKFGSLHNQHSPNRQRELYGA